MMKAAALQMVSGLHVPGNLEQARHLLEQAAAEGRWPCCPNIFAPWARATPTSSHCASPTAKAPSSFLAQAARELGLWVVGGTLPLQCESAHHVRNTSLVFSPQGECVARYDKIHLFRFDNGRERFDEAAVIEAGNTPVRFDLTARDGTRWRVGLSVCYDLRFPELYRQHARAGADLLLVPSAFTHTTGEAHWELLLRARAVENLAYVLAPAQGGLHENGRRTWGHSMVVDPWGGVQAQVVEGPGIALGVLDAARLQQVRQQLPALDHCVL